MTNTIPSTDAAREAARATDGKFGTQEHARPTNGLDAGYYEGEVEQIELEGGKKGIWRVDDSVVEISENERGFTRMMLHTNGRPDWRARNKAAEKLYRLKTDPDELEDRLRALAYANGKASVLRVNKAGQVEAHEMTLTMTSGGQIAYFHKGYRNNAYLLDEDSVLDVYPGYGHQQALADGWAKTKARTPELEKLHAIDGWDDLPVAEGTEPPNEVAAVYMIDHPGFGDGPAAGCMFMATDIQKDDGPNGTHIVNGYFWAPAGSQVESEGGSFYTGDLARWGGKIKDYEPNSMTYRDAWAGMPSELPEGIARVMGK